MDFLITVSDQENLDVHEIEMEILDLLTDPSKVSIDIGANIGQYTEHLIPISKHVYAYEPLPQLAKILSKKFKGDRVTVSAKAVSDKKGTADIHILEWYDKENSRRVYLDGSASIVQDFNQNRKDHPEIFSGVEIIKVPTVILDDEGITNVGFIKIDVEGAEIEVLKGAHKILQSEKPNLLIEIEERHRKGALKTVSDFLRIRGYSGFFIQGKNVHPFEEFDPGELQAVEPLPGIELDRSRHINNFIFLPNDKKEVAQEIQSKVRQSTF